MENICIYEKYDNFGNHHEIKAVSDLCEFAKVIKVFQEPPYYEILSDKDIMEEFQGYMDNGGALGYYINGEIVGINTYLNGVVEEHGIDFPKDSKVIYLAGFAVLKNARGKGVGTELVNSTLRIIERNNDYAYARIEATGSMSENILLKNNFSKVYNKAGDILTQICHYIGINGEKIEDKRNFMVKKLGNKK